MDLERRLTNALHEVADAGPPTDLVPRTLQRLAGRPATGVAPSRQLFALAGTALAALVVVALGIALLSQGGMLAPANDSTPTPTQVSASSPPTATAPAPSSPTPPPVAAIPLCEDVPRVTAPPALYRDSPIYFANEMPVEQLQRWARGKPGFEELWIDRDHLGWVTLAFSRDAEQRQAELERDFPGVGAVVASVDWTMNELRLLQQRVVSELPPGTWTGVGAMPNYGVVAIGLGYLRPEKIAAVEEHFAGERVCIEGVDPALAPEPGPQPEAGDGWRLLASERETGGPYRTGVATEQATYENLWRYVGLPGTPPAVDFESEIVIWFGQVFSCGTLRLDDVVVNQDRALVHTAMSLLDHEGGACHLIAIGHAFVVAVERSKLPRGPFAIQLGANDPPGGAPEERTIVDVDLTLSGSVALPDQVHGDPSLPGPDIEGPVMDTEPGYTRLYRTPVTCGVEWLGPINGLFWRTEAPADDPAYIPPEWQDLVEDGELVLAVIAYEGPQPELYATVNGHQLEYRATTDEPPACP